MYEGLLVAGRLFQLAMLVGLTILFLAAERLVRSVTIRRLAGIDAMQEAINRATETGRPVHYSVGSRPTGVTTGGEYGAAILAGLGILGYVSRQCARQNVDLVVTSNSPETYPIVGQIVRESYVAEGHLDGFHPENIQFLSGDGTAYCVAVMGLFEREKIAANFMIGHWEAETMIILETGAGIGAIQIAGAHIARMGDMIIAADYTIIGEEMYAASAYLSDDPALKRQVRGQDIAKLIILALILVGAALYAGGNRYLYNLLRL